MRICGGALRAVFRFSVLINNSLLPVHVQPAQLPQRNQCDFSGKQAEGCGLVREYRSWFRGPSSQWAERNPFKSFGFPRPRHALPTAAQAKKRTKLQINRRFIFTL
jgi:hypothetical protein